MRRPLFCLLSAFLSCSLGLASAQAANLAQQRQMYDEAKRALAKGETVAQDVSTLENPAILEQLRGA